MSGDLQEHQTEARKLSQKYPENAAQINGILSELETNWQELQRLTNERRASLSQAYTLHKFRAELRELEIWVADTIKRMKEVEPPTGILEAETLLELHQERKAEIDGRQETFKALGEHGRKLIPTGDFVRESLEHLEKLQLELNDAWHTGKQKLKQAHQLQLFKEQVIRLYSSCP
jgi:spectrin beta